MLRSVAQAVILIATLAAPACIANPSQAADPAESSLLVLRNGEVLQGQVAHVEKTYIVTLANGQIRIKEEDVDLLCKNLADGYQRKRAAIQVGNVHQHLELAQWCLRHGLTGFAAAELADATAADPKHPMIRVFQHRLEMAVNPPVADQQPKKPTAGPSNEDLDRLVRGLPRGSAEAFTQAVQPLLMNHCLGSGCHSSPEVPMQLMRVNIGRATSKRSTQRNLHSVLQYVDRATPLESRLLKAPIAAHGTVDHAIFNEHQAAQYKRLFDWVNLVAQQPIQDLPAAELPALPNDGFGDPPTEHTPRMLTPEARRAHPLPGAARKHPNRPDNATNRDEGAHSEGSHREAPAAGAPADPHDPEVFNRRYAPKKPSAPEKPEAEK